MAHAGPGPLRRGIVHEHFVAKGNFKCDIRKICHIYAKFGMGVDLSIYRLILIY